MYLLNYLSIKQIRKSCQVAAKSRLIYEEINLTKSKMLTYSGAACSKKEERAVGRASAEAYLTPRAKVSFVL